MVLKAIPVLTCVAALPLLFGSLALAQADKTQTVKERQELMKSFWPNYVRAFAQLTRGETADLAVVSAKAKEAADAMKKIPALFPVGTDRSAVPETRAAPEIWTKREEFEATAAKLWTETSKLAETAATGSMDAVRAQATKVVDACGGCHGGAAKSGGKFRFEAP